MNKKHQVIYADPPWPYKNKRTGGSMNSGAASKYPVMKLDDIANLPVQKISNGDSVLFLWATVPMLEDALKVLHAWDYEYKTAIFWRKIMSLGMGFGSGDKWNSAYLGFEVKSNHLDCRDLILYKRRLCDIPKSQRKCAN